MPNNDETSKGKKNKNRGIGISAEPQSLQSLKVKTSILLLRILRGDYT